MNTQLAPTRPVMHRGSDRIVQVYFQVGTVVIDHLGYDIMDCFNGEAWVESGADVAAYLESHVADTYPGMELIDWHMAGTDDEF